ncbi:uncharacterized protein LOC132731885 isoform X2 [Ruditapes philippinarum]|uniref:uncharacterized protein LOC132731885 isoform X2 n=1 Tax=Ruditapes philippinarum TaxID=129788 RepID=UPI00295BFABC|nr:uncharacterized protein LOC132731885 isoform X2 [Ruditapes philippinarum]
MEPESEMEPESDETLCMQFQKYQQEDTLEALLDEDTEKNSSLDQPTVCLEHPDTEESMEQLKIIEEDVEDQVIKTIENIQSNLNELTEKINKKMCAEARNQSNLNELKTSVKDSPGLKMITPQEKSWLKLNSKCFFRKQLNFLDYEHFLKYQKTVIYLDHFRPEKPVLCVCPYRYNGHVLASPWCMMYEVYRLLSLRSANIESEHPITIRLARDGFFGDSSGIVSCVFCDSMIPNYLFLSQSHDELITFLDNHCRQCMRRRRRNTLLQNYGNQLNLVDLMASSINLVPSGSSHHTQGTRYNSTVARWITDHVQEIVPSGRCLPQAASPGLPQPDLTPAVIVQQGPIPSDGRSVIVQQGPIPRDGRSVIVQQGPIPRDGRSVIVHQGPIPRDGRSVTVQQGPISRDGRAVIVQQGRISSDRRSVTRRNVPAVSLSTVDQAQANPSTPPDVPNELVVPASRTNVSAVIPRSYINPTPQSSHMAEGESQQQMEEINEQPLNGLGIGTGAGEEIIRGELPSNSDAHVGEEDNTRVDVERQLPEPRSEENINSTEKVKLKYGSPGVKNLVTLPKYG